MLISLSLSSVSCFFFFVFYISLVGLVCFVLFFLDTDFCADSCGCVDFMIYFLLELSGFVECVVIKCLGSIVE